MHPIINKLHLEAKIILVIFINFHSHSLYIQNFAGQFVRNIKQNWFLKDMLSKVKIIFDKLFGPVI